MKPLLTKQGIAYMMFGIVGEDFIAQLFPPEERQYETLDIVPAHIDIFEELKYPLETKWSAQKIFRASDIPESWILQLLRYMAKTNAEIGWLIIVNLFSRGITAFKMKLDSQEEKREQLEEMKKIKELILNAVKKRDSSDLPIKESECPSCSYKPSKKRMELGLGEGCPRYVPRKRTKKTK